MGTERVRHVDQVEPELTSRAHRSAPDNPVHGDLTAVQRAAGNRAALALLGVGQAKLEVGPVDDPYEREADHVAAQVVEVLRSPAPPDGADEVTGSARTVRRRAASGPEGGVLDRDTEAAIGAARSGGTPLSDRVRRQMEGAFGADFGSVRVHDGPAAADLNDRVGAKAFTVGNDVFFRDGSPDANTASGQELLAHELTHTLQQGGQHDEGGRRVARVKGNRAAVSQLETRRHPTVQRLLSKNNPILHTDVANVANPHGNVYILTGLANDSVVVKFELAGPEGPAKFRARYRLAEELGGAMLSGAMAKPELSPADLAELALIPAGLGQSAALVQMLNLGIAQAGIGLKMDRLAMGSDLFELNARNVGGANDAALDSILTTQKSRRYGEMAYFDLLTRNYDRWRADGSVAAKNIDFDATYTDAVPLDNVYNMEGLVNANTPQATAEMHGIRPSARRAYAHTAIQSLIAATGNRPFAAMRVASAEAAFVRGMDDAEARAAVHMHPWIVAEGPRGGLGAGRTRQAARQDTDRFDAKAVLVMRYNAGRTG